MLVVFFRGAAVGELAVERAEFEGLVGLGVFLDRQVNLESAAAFVLAEGGEAFAQAAGAGEEVDDGDGCV